MSTAPSAGKTIDDLQAVVRDVEALLHATAAQGGEKLEAVRKRAAESLQKARERLSVLEEDAVREMKIAAARTDDYVHENPWQAVGVAVGVGFLLGLLIGRR
jgi:ElaB/YqjD/DUF883 family membrane-anchored ribosome-binding protein